MTQTNMKINLFYAHYKANAAGLLGKEQYKIDNQLKLFKGKFPRFNAADKELRVTAVKRMVEFLITYKTTYPEFFQEVDHTINYLELKVGIK